MPMRVIAGTAKGRQLKRVPGDGTRPIMDRVKEALFNIIGENIYGASFLDLFAGTGSVGIEALSRGAAYAVFVENARPAVKTITENLKTTGFEEQAAIISRDVFDYLRQPEPEPFEFIYIAPPQYQNLWRDALLLLDGNPNHLQPDGVVIVQIDPQEKQDVPLNVLVPTDERRYGNTLLCFFERPSE
ncbi:MAG: 16S rRNA (guanine(966)-N(2))-methyltransferase RsmD [Anaerolineae bacterium]|nr:16S rRNA (guanine(966)-N(2))-methyltransferase RsmD [Anaerolineae bacterium]